MYRTGYIASCTQTVPERNWRRRDHVACSCSGSLIAVAGCLRLSARAAWLRRAPLGGTEIGREARGRDPNDLAIVGQHLPPGVGQAGAATRWSSLHRVDER